MKTMVSEKRTQVYFPKDVYQRIEKKAKKESKSSAAVIREAVLRYLEEEREVDWESDPLFKAVGFIKSGVTDMSINHDHYLYGMPKKSEDRKK